MVAIRIVERYVVGVYILQLRADNCESWSPARAVPGGSPLTPVNRVAVEKMAAPEIAKTVRQMFETGQVVGRRDVKKTKPSAELASESGVFENEPTSVDDGVVRSTDLPATDVDQVLRLLVPSDWIYMRLYWAHSMGP